MAGEVAPALGHMGGAGCVATAAARSASASSSGEQETGSWGLSGPWGLMARHWADIPGGCPLPWCTDLALLSREVDRRQESAPNLCDPPALASASGDVSPQDVTCTCVPRRVWLVVACAPEAWGCCRGPDPPLRARLWSAEGATVT